MLSRPRCLVALLLPLLLAAAPVERDWGATLRGDAQALHDDVATNHPGSFNPDDPGFTRRNESQLQLAHRRAGTARSYADYFFAMRAYAASFDDGHVGFGVYANTPSDTRWPGFLTSYRADGEQRVTMRSDDSPVPMGARLIACDGRPAERLLEENVGRFIGRWALLSQRLSFGSDLFAYDGNPYVRRPERCAFEVAGRRRHVALAWRPIDPRDLGARLVQLEARPRQEIAVRTLGDGTRWISLGSFAGDSRSPAVQALASLVASLRADRSALAAAPAIVLDLRANDGGSSDWPRQIAEIVWGRAAFGRLPPDPARVDWRVSADNLATLRERRERQIAGGALSPDMRGWFDRVIGGLEGALERGEALWREPGNEAGPAAAAAPGDAAGPRLRGPVYLITDARCASACLDAVDLWRALGAVHVGQTTSADTFYMDIKVRGLPSGLGEIVVPMKVYRGRKRGSNQPVAPVHAFAGDIADTAALERWVAALRERRR